MNSKISVNVTSTSELGKKTTKAVSDISPTATDKSISDFTNALYGLTNSTISKQTRVDVRELVTNEQPQITGIVLGDNASHVTFSGSGSEYHVTYNIPGALNTTVELGNEEVAILQIPFIKTLPDYITPVALYEGVTYQICYKEPIIDIPIETMQGLPQPPTLILDIGNVSFMKGGLMLGVVQGWEDYDAEAYQEIADYFYYVLTMPAKRYNDTNYEQVRIIVDFTYDGE